MTGHALDGHRLRDGARAGLGGASLRRAPAQEVQGVGRGPRTLTETLLHVGEGGLAVAQRGRVAARATGQLDRSREQHRLERGHRRTLRREPQLGGRHVGVVPHHQVVVDLHHDLAALVELDAEPWAQHRLAASGRPRPQPLGVVGTSAKSLTPLPPKQVQPGPSSSASTDSAVGHLVGRHPEQDHVVDDVTIAGQHVGAGQVGVALEARVEQEAAVVVGADSGRRAGRVGLGHRERQPALSFPQRDRLRVLAGVLVGRARNRRCGARGDGLGRRLRWLIGSAPDKGQDGDQGQREGCGVRRWASWRPVSPGARSSTGPPGRGGGCGTRSGRPRRRC